MKHICIDSGFLIGLYDERDQHHELAKQYFSRLFEVTANRLVVPWPVLYEALSTRMARDRRRITTLERHWVYLRARDQLHLLDDQPFRGAVVEETFEELRKPVLHYRALSLVDRVLRNVLSDVSIRIDAFVTFNRRDFIDVCMTARRMMFP